GGIGGMGAGGRAHDAVARLVVLPLGPGLPPPPRPLEPNRRADPAVAAVGDAACGGKIGAIERGGPHLHQHLVGLRARLRYVVQRESLFSRNGSLHLVLRRLLRPVPGRTQVGPLMPRARAWSSATPASWIGPFASSPSRAGRRRSLHESATACAIVRQDAVGGPLPWRPTRMERTKPPFRAEHVGSLIRPAALIDAREKAAKNEIPDAELKRVQHAAIREVVRL